MPEPVLENHEIKQRAIRRLIVAVVLVFLAVGILTYLSYYKPAKVVTNPATGTLAPPVASPTSPPSLITPPAPSVSTKPLPAPGPGPKKAALEPPKPLVKSEPQKTTPLPTTTSPAAQPSPTAAKPTPAPSGYVVQFGVFSNPQNAQQLIEQLKHAGIEAKTETRVQLPAFKTKVEADAALAKMKEKGISATLLAR